MSAPDYKREIGICADFLHHFDSPDDGPKYMKQLTRIMERSRHLLEVELEDIETHSSSHVELERLLENLEGNTRRYAAIFADAADSLMQDTRLFPPQHFASVPTDVFDVLRKQRADRNLLREQEQGPNPAAGVDPQNSLPAELLRRFDVVFIPREKSKHLKLREVAAKHIGKLVTLGGIVTQMTDVKPLVSVATYLDMDSQCEVYQVVTGLTFGPLERGPQQVGARGGNKQPLKMQTHASKFVSFQEIKLQERSTEVPQGNTPRTMKVYLRGALTRSCKPGDSIEVSGVFLPEPVTGIKAMKMGLLANTFLDAMHIKQLKQSYEEHINDAALQEQLAAMDGQDMYDRLSSSIAPEIFGHEDVKKALLLLMVGGPSGVQGDGLKQRGDIHVCLMGDPGVAKSQLIKHIAHISPRAVYTTGKGSSGVGLTAAVQRDPITQEMVLEGGALVLADKGICCIDEFDKMEEGDRTNIHEVMEQQTVSIAKAGINTSLNARTTLLAAANPAWGRYDTRRSPAENINLPAALLSRFDLMWLILDKADPDQDRRLAKHVLSVHKDGRPPVQEGQNLFSPELLRAYIARAKQFAPHIPHNLTEPVAVIYAEMRAEEASNKMPHSYTTARTLLSILRLAQALARLRFSSRVIQPDIDEALRLMRMSKTSLVEHQGGSAVQDPTTAIFTLIRDDAASKNNKTIYPWSELVALLGRSYTNAQIKAAVEEYAEYNVFHLDYPRTEEPTVHILGD